MKNSIVAGMLARAVCAALTGGKRYVSETSKNRIPITLSARRCTRKGKPSGGLVLEASAPAPTYGGLRVALTKRLRSGWTTATAYKHGADLVETLRQSRTAPIVALRERVFAFSESKDIDPDAVPENIGMPFDEMSETECRLALAWLEALPDKPDELDGISLAVGGTD
jgi:hypothetical protein